MISELDKIINICHQPAGPSNEELKSILLTLATSVKQILISLK